MGKGGKRAAAQERKNTAEKIAQYFTGITSPVLLMSCIASPMPQSVIARMIISQIRVKAKNTRLTKFHGCYFMTHDAYGVFYVEERSDINNTIR
jgi:hypothetical protein